MSKRTYGHVLVLPSRRLVRTAAEDDFVIKLTDEELKTDLVVKPTDTHQFLDPTSSQPYHCKKAMPYSQGLRLNRICSGMRILINVVAIWKNG